MSLRKLPSRILLALSLAALALPFGCSNDREPTGVRLVLTSELSEGKSGNTKEIDYVQIDWDRSGNAGTVSEGQLTAGDELGIPQFPASLTFYDEPKDDTEPTDDRLQLKITAFLTGATRKKIERRVQIKFIDQVTQRLIIPLRFSCVERADCDINSTATCVDGECVPVKEEPPTSPSTRARTTPSFPPRSASTQAPTGASPGPAWSRPSASAPTPRTPRSATSTSPTRPAQISTSSTWASSGPRPTAATPSSTRIRTRAPRSAGRASPPRSRAPAPSPSGSRSHPTSAKSTARAKPRASRGPCSPSPTARTSAGRKNQRPSSAATRPAAPRRRASPARRTRAAPSTSPSQTRPASTA